MNKEQYLKLSEDEKRKVPVKILFQIGYNAIQKNKEVEKENEK